MRAVDTAAFAPTPSRELHAVAAWRVDCVDDYEKHRLKNYTMNVSRKKAFLKRAGLACYGRCVRGVVDGFATHAEIDELRALTPEPSRGAADVGAASAIDHWRWAVPAAPAAFRTLVRRAQTVLDERFGVRHLRFYRSNIITWDGETGGVAEAAPARLRALYRQYHPSGMLGVDKRGCPVIYGRLGCTDLAGLVREAGIGFHRQQEFYHNLLTWDVTYMQSVRRGASGVSALAVPSSQASPLPSASVLRLAAARTTASASARGDRTRTRRCLHTSSRATRRRRQAGGGGSVATGAASKKAASPPKRSPPAGSTGGGVGARRKAPRSVSRSSGVSGLVAAATAARRAARSAGRASTS